MVRFHLLSQHINSCGADGDSKQMGSNLQSDSRIPSFLPAHRGRPPPYSLPLGSLRTDSSLRTKCRNTSLEIDSDKRPRSDIQYILFAIRRRELLSSRQGSCTPHHGRISFGDRTDTAFGTRVVLLYYCDDRILGRRCIGSSKERSCGT
jgi:hypothetical protein